MALSKDPWGDTHHTGFLNSQVICLRSRWKKWKGLCNLANTHIGVTLQKAESIASGLAFGNARVLDLHSHVEEAWPSHSHLFAIWSHPERKINWSSIVLSTIGRKIPQFELPIVRQLGFDHPRKPYSKSHTAQYSESKNYNMDWTLFGLLIRTAELNLLKFVFASCSTHAVREWSLAAHPWPVQSLHFLSLSKRKWCICHKNVRSAAHSNSLRFWKNISFPVGFQLCLDLLSRA